MSDKQRSPQSGILEFQRRVLELQRSAFNSSFKAIDQLQEQQEEMLGNMLKQVPGVSPDAGDAIESWTRTFRDSRQQYYDAAQKGFDLYGQLIERATKPPGSDD